MAKTTEAQADAENAEAEGEGEEGKKAGKPDPKLPKLSLKLMIIAGGAFLLLVGAGGGAYFFLGGHGKEEAQANAAARSSRRSSSTCPTCWSTCRERRRSHPISQGEGRARIAGRGVSAQIQPVMPRLIDTFQTYLRELRPTDLDGSAGLYRLKEELTRRVNAAIAPNRINAVLFKEIVVQ